MATSGNASPKRGGSHFSSGAPTGSASSAPRQDTGALGSTGAVAPHSALASGRVSSRTAAATRRAGSTKHARQLGSGQSKSRLPLVLVAVVGALALAAAVAFVVVPMVFPPAEGDSGEHEMAETGTQVTFTIPEGSGASVVAQVLYDNGLIEDTNEFLSQMRIANAEQAIKSGSYEILAGSDIPAIIQLITTGPNVSTAQLVIPEGYTVAQIATTVEESLGIPADEFTAQAKASNYAGDYAFLATAANDSLEGYLFPKTYDFSSMAEVTADAVIRAMLDQFALELETAGIDLDATAATLSERFGYALDANDVVTMASIVEREAASDDQRGNVASVLYNRLGAGMKLQSDATLMYVLGHSPSADELAQSQDPYNTYYVDGLTPTPICSPSLASLQAAVAPPDTNYYYFFITPDSAQFSETYDEHQQSYS